jgi:hypothetical protein
MEASLSTRRIASAAAIYVAAIMPYALASGKAPYDAAVMRPHCDPCIFRKTE